MKKYACSVCGFVYDESTGNPESGVAAGTKWAEVPNDWICPLCGASKDEFEEQAESTSSETAAPVVDDNHLDQMRELSFGEISALCSNLAKGCAKQYLPEEADLFNQLSEYYKNKAKPVKDAKLEDLLALIQQDLNSGYPTANSIAGKNADRGSLRAITWGEKVTKVLNSLIKRHETQQDAILHNTNIYVCEICGFVFIGDEPPDICPICKVPRDKLTQIQRRS